LYPNTFHVKDRKTGKTTSYEQYRFPGKNGLELDTSQVINDVLASGKRLSPGHPLCGLLLATGGLMPRYLFHGRWIDAGLVVTTTDAAEHYGTMRLWTDCLSKTKKSVMRRPDLFRDPVESGALYLAPSLPKLRYD